MNVKQIVGLTVLLQLAAAGALWAQDKAANRAIRAAVDHPGRPDADKQRDPDRKPADVLRFYGIRPGMKVADLMAGAGYYTEILARVVGPDGAVYAQNNAISARNYGKALGERIEAGGLKNVIRLDRELEEPGLPEGELDAVFMVLFYHDTYWMNVDRAKMNKQILASLKLGGLYCVIDHAARAGDGATQVKSLHRVEASIVKAEVLDAGFVFDGETDLLHHPEDDHTISVFDAAMRGKSDRFVFRFRKPKD